MWKCSSNDVTHVITPQWLYKGVVHDYKKTFKCGQYNVGECGRGVTRD